MNASEQCSSINLFFKKNKQKCFELIQNGLLDKNRLTSFSKKLEFYVSVNDPSSYIKLGWLNPDGLNTVSQELFHPFRFYPLHIGGELFGLNITPTSSLEHNSFSDNVKKANLIATLAILLEPIYWPEITLERGCRGNSFEEYDEKLTRYKDEILSLVKTLNPAEWKNHHNDLVFQAYKMDKNSDLYILLRISSWRKTKKTTGKIGGALWIRLMAEVLRRAFRDAFHDVDWPEEDLLHGQDKGPQGLREKIFGTAFPTDNTLIAKHHLLFEFGLHTRSILRWYLEGETEYYAALYSLSLVAYRGIELINLKGAIGNEKASTPLRLADHLAKDKESRRFSFISFDSDVSANVKAIETQVKNGNVIGYINRNEPDFEFANFTLHELIEVAASLDEKQGFDAQAIRNGPWDNINSGKTFEDRYRRLSKNEKSSSLKGEIWGKALAQYAFDSLLISDSKKSRPFFETLNFALHASRVNYEFQKNNFLIDPKTFKNEKKE